MFGYTISPAAILCISLLAFASDAHAGMGSGGSIYAEREATVEQKSSKRARLTGSEYRRYDSRVYIGLNSGQFTHNQKYFDNNVDRAALFTRVGRVLSRHLSMELRMGLAMWGFWEEAGAEKEWQELAENPTVYLDLSLGAYMRIGLPVQRQPHLPLFEPYIIIGATQASLSANTLESDTPDHADIATQSYGAGLAFTPKTGPSYDIEFMRYIDKDGFVIEGFSFGVNWRK